MKKSLLLCGLLFTSVVSETVFAQSQTAPRFQDRIAVFDLRPDFRKASRGLGFLQGAQRLNANDREEMAALVSRLDTVKSRYKSQFTDAMWEEMKGEYEQGFALARQLESQAPAANAYACTSKDSQGRESSAYVKALNESIQGARLSLYRLENLLPKPSSSGMLMLTNNDYAKINGPSRACGSGAVSASTAQATAAPKKVRVAPYSASRNPQHEMMCRTLDDPRIPPPPGVKCVFNYKEN
jgi:hypothetical protein